MPPHKCLFEAVLTCVESTKWSLKRAVLSIYVVVINLGKSTPKPVRSKMLCSTNVEECFDASYPHQTRYTYGNQTYLVSSLTCKPGCSE